MKNKNFNRYNNDDEYDYETKKAPQVKLKSEMYNQDNEQLVKREEDKSDAIMWGCVLGFILFLILLIFILVFTR